MTSIKDSTYGLFLPEKARLRPLKREHHKYN